MTVRRKPDTDEFQVRPDKQAISFRLIIVVAVCSMHPLGQQMLTTMGFTLPASSAALHKAVAELTTNLAQVRAELAAVKHDISTVKNQMTSFEVNFDKHKVPQP